MSEVRKQSIEELGKLMRRDGEAQALALVSAFVSGYNAAKEEDKTKTAADAKPETETEKAG